MKHPLHQFLFCPLCGQKTFAEYNVKAKRCTACGFIYYFNPSSAVAAFVRDEAGRLLVVRRANDPAAGTLDLPGGFVDAHETAEEALLREIREETGLCPDAPQYLFSIPNLYPYSGFDVHTLDMFFACKLSGVGDKVVFHAADDVSETLFLPLADIRPSDFGLPSVHQAVTRYLAIQSGNGQSGNGY
jgi:ADP-ribose pyrophosphatase YjhB (NUDIX family)